MCGTSPPAIKRLHSDDIIDYIFALEFAQWFGYKAALRRIFLRGIKRSEREHSKWACFRGKTDSSPRTYSG